MFEDSLMESQHRVSSPNQRWTALLSMTLQSCVAGTILALPILRPEALPLHIDARTIVLQPKPIRLPAPQVASASGTSATATATIAARNLTQPTSLPALIHAMSEIAPTAASLGAGMGDPNSLANAAAGARFGSGTNVGIAPVNAPPRTMLHVSTGVSSGMLLAPIRPAYPRIAIASRVEGVIKVEAVISKSGQIESAHVTSGPEMLRQAALDAVRNAHYTPYLLNGAPVEVETIITVNFKLSS